MSELKNKKNLVVDQDIVAFFGLPAWFDYKDKQKEKSGLKTESPVSAPEGSVLSSEIR